MNTNTERGKRMKAVIKQQVNRIDTGQYQAFVQLYDAEYGDLLYEAEQEFPKSNEVYAGYKSIQAAANEARKHGVSTVAIESNVPAIAEELAGNRENVNSKLLRYTRERFEGHGITIENN